jgi:hypothetical protein
MADRDNDAVRQAEEVVDVAVLADVLRRHAEAIEEARREGQS